MKNIGIIFNNNGKGGGIYSQLVTDAIKNDFNIEMHETLTPQQNKLYNYSKLYYQLSKLYGQKDVWIRTSNSIITLPFDHTHGKNIALIYHIDNSFKSFPLKIISETLDKIMIRNLNSVDKLVVISQFWKDYFEKLGNTTIEIIYNPFNFEEFVFNYNDITEFKQKKNLSKKPIIYLGNCQKAKGVVEAYKALKELDAYLVTSGIKDVNLPIIHLNLNYKDYLKLLHASSTVVTMSKFNEGWCRTAHEAMICKTPVVGSGMGGMNELLQGGKQIICPDFSKLMDWVEYAIDEPALGKSGYTYATQECFSFNFFKKKWINLINAL